MPLCKIFYPFNFVSYKEASKKVQEVLMQREEKKLEEHMAKVTKAITKINEGTKLNDEDIREIFKSLMNAQMVVSETSEKLEKEFDREIKVQRDRIDKLEDFLFRGSKKNRRSV